MCSASLVFDLVMKRSDAEMQRHNDWKNFENKKNMIFAALVHCGFESDLFKG